MYRKEFPLDDNLIYLNHAAVAPWPARTALAVSQFAHENASQGATHYLKWLKTEQALREHLCWLINAPSSDDIALQKSTSEALSTIAYGLDWSAGDNLVIYQQEFPSNRLVWQMLGQYGVECRLVDLDSDENPEDALLNQCDEHTRLISVSSIQYASGLRTDLFKIKEFCQANKILLCVDAIQSLGAFEFDVQKIGADFVVADGHKWMLGPEGIALLYVNPELRNSMKLHQFGWHMVEPVGDYDSMETTPAKTARRFECGSPNMLGIHALNSSLSLIKEVGLEQISTAIMHNSVYLNTLILSHPQLELISSTNRERISGIVTFRVKGGNHARIYKELMSRGIICAPRGGGIRFSPHFYINTEKLARAMQIVDEIIN
jgi:cysteine desulfurase/selenocysteine lyase